MYNKYHDKGFTILAVDSWDHEDVEMVRTFARKNELPYPILLKGGGAGGNWGVRFIPDNFFINRDGKVVKRMAEITDQNLEKTEAIIERLLK